MKTRARQWGLGRPGGGRAVAAVLAATLLAGTAGAQESGQAGSPAGPAQGDAEGGNGHRGPRAGMGRVMGEVTGVNGMTLTVKDAEGGTEQIVTTDNTRVMKDGNPVKISALHTGDGVGAFGNMDAPNRTLHAAVVMAEDAAEIKAMRNNLGKTYITGRVTAVDLDNARLTVERADHVAQTIGFDETTSFRRPVRGNGGSGGPGGSGNGGDGAGSEGRGSAGRGAAGGFGGNGGGTIGMGMAVNGGIDRAFEHGESITLADIKVGDFLAGTGALKNGVFVPTRVVDSPPGRRRREGGAAAPAAGANTGANGAGTAGEPQ